MRAYWLPFGAGLFLVASAFLPWVTMGDESVMGFPDMAALWIVGLGLLASILATLSMITRRNSRHPLLLVGLVALGIDVLSWRRPILGSPPSSPRPSARPSAGC
jgi:hypothetical protein